jgi:hypothetical protein
MSEKKIFSFDYNDDADDDDDDEAVKVDEYLMTMR